MRNVEKQTEYQYMPFIVKELEDRRGGLSVALAPLRKDVGVVPPGAYIGVDEKGLGHILKSAVLVEVATALATEYKVKKAHQLIAGEPITSKDATSAKAFNIVSIDTSNAEYDVVKVGTAIGVALEAGMNLIAVKAEDSTGGSSVLPHDVVGITKREIITTESHAEVGVLTKGTVNVANLAFGAPKFFRDACIHITYED
jgi:hypothetical protein